MKLSNWKEAVVVGFSLISSSIAIAQIPTGWLDQDVGSVGITGSASYANATFTVSGAGGQIYGSADAFHFVYQSVSGDGSIVARVANIQNGAANAAVGLMVRETLSEDSTNIKLADWPSYHAFYLDMRGTTGGGTSEPASVGATTPYWVKLVRSGTNFSSYGSTDGVNWTQVGASQSISMASDVEFGLVVTSGSMSSLATATFDNVSLSTAAVPAPVITGVSATNGSIGSQVLISGSGFGNTQGDSVVLLNDMPATVGTWSDSSITITIPEGATSGALAVSVAPSMNQSNPIVFTVTSQPVPPGWLDQDVGATGTAGSASYANATFTVSGAGTHIDGTADSFHFVYQPVSGDGSIVARVVDIVGGSGNAAVGVMVRETLLQDSANIKLADWPTFHAFYLDLRSTAGAGTSEPAVVAASTPYWVKLVRSGTSFSSYGSTDGVNWTQVGATQTISMASNVDFGLAVTSGSTSSLATATFDNVSGSFTGQGGGPSISGVSPTIAMLGTSVTITGSNFGSTPGTVTINGVAVTTANWTSTSINATVPSTAASGNVVVTVSGTSSNAVYLTILPIPSISSISPPAGAAGATTTINGSGFGSTQAGNRFVSFGGAVAGIVSWSDTAIQATVPTLPTGATTVSVSIEGFSSNGVQFTVEQPPSITAMSPLSGTGGTIVTIDGSGFGATQSGSAVYFDGVAAAINSWSDIEIVAVVPATSTGVVKVSVGGLVGLGPTFNVNTIAVLTNSQGNETTYVSTMVNGAWVLLSANGPGCSSCSVRNNVQNTYDTDGNLLTTTDANGNTVSYTYDSNNNVLSTTAQLNGAAVTTSYTYNDFGEVLTTTDPLGNVTTNAYDAHGNLTSVTLPAPDAQTPASVTQFAYDNLGELSQITDPLSHVTTITYTPAGLIASIIDAQNNTTSFQYDARGNRTAVIDPINGSAHPTTFSFDIMNRLTGILYPDGTSGSFGYDYRGRRISATDQNNHTTTYAYDDADRLLSVTDPANNVTQYSYDTEGNLTSITDAANHTTQFSYDAFGRVIQTTFPSSLIETYGYDLVGNLTSKTDRKGQTIQYLYDALYRLTNKIYPDSTNANYIYDLVGKIQQVSDPTGTYGFAYDNMGRLIGTTTQYSYLPGANFQNTYTYDAASNRQSLTAPDGSITTYGYDTLNRLNGLANSWAGSFGFAYDALGRRTQLTRPNGINTNYGYDAVSRLMSVLHQAGSNTLDGASYTYDADGNRTSKTNYLNGVTSNYGYDTLYELTQVTEGTSTTESYSYDAVGNRISSVGVPTYSFNSSNELTSSSSGSYTYDANGNTLSDAQGRSFTWDFENRLTQVVNPSVGTTTFKYDPFGRRIQKASPVGTTNYLYDGVNSGESVVQEADSSGNALADYAQGLGLDQPLAELRTGTTNYFQQDDLNSITSLTNSAGVLTNTYTYDSYGKVVGSTGSLTDPFRYIGREFDSETGLLFDRARYYDPSLGRFISEDPIEFMGSGPNLYGYVSNAPTSLTDPIGLTDCVVTATGVVCTNWGPGLNWLTPHEPQPPMAPIELWPTLSPRCGCDKIREIDERAREKLWETITELAGTTTMIKSVEHWGRNWAKRLVPVADALDFVHLEYSLWKIERDREQEIRNVHKECGEAVPTF